MPFSLFVFGASLITISLIHPSRMSGIMSGTCSMSDTTQSSDSSIKNFDLVCNFLIEEAASSSMKYFYPLFHDKSICSTGSILNTFELNGISQPVTCNCIKGLDAPNNYDGIQCFKIDGTNYDNTLSNTYKFTLKNLALSTLTKELIIDAYMRDPSLSYQYVMGPRVILSIQSPLSLTYSGTSMTINSNFALKHPAYCKVTFDFTAISALIPKTGLCSDLSSSYSGLCSYAFTSTTSTLDLPFLNLVTTNFLLTPSPLSITTEFSFSTINSNPNDYLIITVFEPSGKAVEIIKTKISSIPCISNCPNTPIPLPKSFLTNYQSIFDGFVFILIILLI